MIADLLGGDTLADFVALACYSALLFSLGVAWSIYKAVDWVEKMRAWAHAVELAEINDPPAAAAGLDNKGMKTDDW